MGIMPYNKRPMSLIEFEKHFEQFKLSQHNQKQLTLWLNHRISDYELYKSIKIEEVDNGIH